MTKHTLSIRPVASGAGRGECSCGWRSRVSDDADYHSPDYYSTSNIRRDWRAHVEADHEPDYMSITRDTVTQ